MLLCAALDVDVCAAAGLDLQPSGGGAQKPRSLAVLPVAGNVLMVSTGTTHTCTVLADGQALCFGSNGQGQLCLDRSVSTVGTVIGETAGAIVQVPTGVAVVSISTGEFHTCAVLDNGQALCFGFNGNGQLGLDRSVSQVGAATGETAGAIVQVPTGATIVSVSAGSRHTCAVLNDGRALCFGDNGSGRLGLDKNILRAGTTQGSTATSIVQLPATDFTLATAVARRSTCAITASATITCWGSNAQGQITTGTNDSADKLGDDEVPSSAGAVALPGTAGAVNIATGPEHACALLPGGELACWGNSAEGRTGYGDATITPGLSNTPAAQGLLVKRTGHTLLQVTLGEGHTCGLYEADTACRSRSVVCWGRNAVGQLGTGDSDGTARVVTPATAPEVQLHSGETVVSIDAGKDHTCAIYISGGLVCWGSGGSGRLGSGAADDIGLAQTPGSLPMVAPPPGRTAVQATCGAEHTCVLLDDGGVLCFGAGGSGRLGYGDETARGGDSGSKPEQLATLAIPGGRRVIGVSAGAEHTCAVLDDFTLACWGEGDDGRLGYGNTADVGAAGPPTLADAGTVRMPHGALVASVSAGETHTCATLRVGAVVCWGASPNGELGRGNTDTVGAVLWLQPGCANAIVVPPLRTLGDVVADQVQGVSALCSVTPTPSMSPSVSPSVSGSPAPSVTGTPSVSPSVSPSATFTASTTPPPDTVDTAPGGAAATAFNDSSSLDTGPVTAIALVAAVVVAAAALLLFRRRAAAARRSARAVPAPAVPPGSMPAALQV